MGRLIDPIPARKSGKLDGLLLYMSGPIEMAPDGGVGWRRDFSRLAAQSGLDITLIDPTRKPGEDEWEISEANAHQERLQKEGRFDELRDFVHDYRRKDLRFVDNSDALVVLIERDVYQCGTLNEVFVAETQHKPIIVICEGGLRRLPRWLFDVVDFDLVFENVEDVVKKLVELDKQDKPLDSRWVLVRKHLKPVTSQPDQDSLWKGLVSVWRWALLLD